MKKVIVVDDHPLVREGIKKTLNRTVDLEVTGEATNGNELLAYLRKESPDIVILDINLPSRNGIEVLKDLNKQYPNLPVLILSMHPEERMALRAFKAGAWGYISKSKISDELIKAVRKITFKNRHYISDKVAQELALNSNAHNSSSPHEQLSDREFQIMRLIAQDLSIKEIAEQLLLSPQTVYTYRDRIKKKMELDSNVAITRYVIKHNLSG